MEIKEFLLRTNPSVQAIELENRGISRAEGLVELLARFQQLRRLSLQNNKLRYIPEGLQVLQRLEEINILGNPIDDLQQTAEVLGGLPNLKSLNISLSSSEEEDYIIQALPLLEVLNQRKIQRVVEIPQEEEEELVFECRDDDFQGLTYLQKQDVEEVVVRHQSSLLEERNSNTNFGNDQLVLGDLKELRNENYQDRNDPEDKAISSEEIQSIRKLVWDARAKCENEKDQNLCTLIELKHKYSLYETCFSKAIEFTEKMDQRLFESFAAIHDSHAIIFKQMSQIIMDQAKEITAIKDTIPPETDTSIENVRALENQVESLRAENKRFLDKIIRLSKGGDPALRDSTASKLNQVNPKTFESQFSPQNQRASFQLSHSKSLTLNQLKEIIQEIYASKEWFDTKEQKKMHLPPQTLEMHMYEYLTQKYGLKTIVIEQASTIISAIRRFTSEDNDVAVFTKILKNECDENFRLVQGQLKKTIKELLNMHLKGKYPLKNTLELKAMVEQRTNGNISFDEAGDIMSYMYNKEDSNRLIEQLKDQASLLQNNPVLKKGQRREETGRDNVEKQGIPYPNFEKIVLDFQLRSHENFLQPLCQFFQEFDMDSDGILSEEEFRTFMQSIPIPQQSVDQTERFLKVLDPFTNGKITFSQVVNLFSEELVVLEKSQVSILQYLSIKQPH